MDKMVADYYDYNNSRYCMYLVVFVVQVFISFYARKKR